MGYKKDRLLTSTIASIITVILVVYLVSSSMVAMALMPALGAGGVYLSVDFIEGNVGTVYPEYQGDGTGFGSGDTRQNYNVPITTTTPACGGDGIPMLVIELDGQARAENFSLRKDIKIPFLEDKWLVVEIDDPAPVISGENLKLFATQFSGDFLRVRNVRLLEGGIQDEFTESEDTWGPDSSQLALQGGANTKDNIPGLEGKDIQAWIHGATGERVTLETPPGEFVNVDISYQTAEQVIGFYNGTNDGQPKLGYGGVLTDENYESENANGFFDVDRINRGRLGGTADDSGYFTCSDLGKVGYP
jgi:hypothetical protein